MKRFTYDTIGQRSASAPTCATRRIDEQYQTSILMQASQRADAGKGFASSAKSIAHAAAASRNSADIAAAQLAIENAILALQEAASLLAAARVKAAA